MSQQLLDPTDELTVGDFLRRLSYDNKLLTDQFDKFYDQAADCQSDSDSSDDEGSSQSTQSSQLTQSTQSTSTASQLEVNDPYSFHDDDATGDFASFRMQQQSFAQANEGDSDNLAANIHLNDPQTMQQTFATANVCDSDQQQSVRPGEYMVDGGFVCHTLKVIPPSVKRKREEKMQREEEAKKRKEETEKKEEETKKRMQKMLEALDGTEVVYECKCSLCKINDIDTHCAPCGHLCCRIWWNSWLPSFRKIIEQKFDSRQLIEEAIKSPSCMFCRKPVTAISNAFSS